VKLDRPDWGPHSHSLAVTVQGPRLDAAVHMMINAYWESLDFELPPVPSECKGPWHRWIDTSRDSPEDICEWLCGVPVMASHYAVAPRSLVILVAKGP
jgi:glycogen operon protein